jgi:predicted alpha-1,6-mannanase (GH76 family)
MSFRFIAVVLCVSILCTPGRATPSGPGAGSPSEARVLHGIARGIETLQTWYVWDTGRWRTTGWWNAANDITMIVNYSRLRGSRRYRPVVENTFNVNAPGGFVNDAMKYDDEGWWALAWIDAYDWTGNAAYLDMARAIFADMTVGWDDVCGGGIWWTKDRRYKNAIANELFLSVAAHLANRLTDPEEHAQALAWAESEWAWFSQSGMINQDNLINDGLNNCRNNHQTTWTYNQGVILGGLAELYQQDQDPAERDAAQTIASAAIDSLTDVGGILHDPCEPTCNGDRVQFKGIFLRNLMALNDAFPDERYAHFAAANARSIWSRDRGPGYQFGEVWSGPFESAAAGTQSSALDALIAAAEMRTAEQDCSRMSAGPNSAIWCPRGTGASEQAWIGSGPSAGSSFGSGNWWIVSPPICDRTAATSTCSSPASLRSRPSSMR